MQGDKRWCRGIQYLLLLCNFGRPGVEEKPEFIIFNGEFVLQDTVLRHTDAEQFRAKALGTRAWNCKEGRLKEQASESSLERPSLTPALHTVSAVVICDHVLIGVVIPGDDR